MAPRYIHTEKALSDLSPVMPITLSDTVSPEENAGDFKCLAGHLYKEHFTFHTSLLHTLQAHSIEVSGITFKENMIQCKNNKSTVKLTLRSVKQP